MSLPDHRHRITLHPQAVFLLCKDMHPARQQQDAQKRT